MPGVCLLLTESGLEAKQDLADQQGAEINYADPEVRSWTLGKKPRCCCGQYNQLDNSIGVSKRYVEEDIDFQSCKDSKNANDTDEPFADAEKMRLPICIGIASEG